jgi:hypothetical protein
MREEKGSSQPRGEKCPLPLRNMKLCILPFFDYLFNKHARLNTFSWLQGHGNLRISRIVRFILPFFFSLYDEYVCSPMLIFPMIVYFNC